MGWGWYPRYVSVAERRRKAAKEIEKMKKKGRLLQPVAVEGRTIAHSFWGKAWCSHLESYSDYENRLPRGRTYVRNGSVFDLQVTPGKIRALVSGSSLYKVDITVSPLAASRWKSIHSACAGKVDSLVELLQGKLSGAVMEIISDPAKGLFPGLKEIQLNCSCPDWAEMCKHVAAVLYGVGARLDARPEELFLLRQVDHLELITVTDSISLVARGADAAMEGEDLSALFGIEMEGNADGKTAKPVSRAVSKKKMGSSRKTRGIVKSKKPMQKKSLAALLKKVAKKSVKKAEKIAKPTGRKKSVGKKPAAGKKYFAVEKRASQKKKMAAIGRVKSF